jgi:hypothetical protein
MRLLAGLVKRNILTQLVLPGVYVWQTALLLATSFDAPRLYWGLGMHAPRLFILSHAGESCCRLVWGAYSAQHYNTRVPAPADTAGASCRGGQAVAAPKLARAVKAL